VRVPWTTLLYKSRNKPQEPLRRPLREIAATHVRYGYRHLTMLLRREGWNINAKRVYRLYDEENLKVRSVERKKIASRQRIPQAQATRPNQFWSADFVSDKLADGRERSQSESPSATADSGVSSAPWSSSHAPTVR